MVGVVVVSHSKALADSVCALALEGAPGAPIVGVGGTGENYQDFGTDAFAIMQAIEEVYSEDGVLLLMDMGSALLSAQTAIGLLEDSVAACVQMCAAPLVEGAVVAAVQASIGSDIVGIKREVRNALSPKVSQIGDASVEGEASKASVEHVHIPNGAVQCRCVITNEHGLHARPAAALVMALAKYEVEACVALERLPQHTVCLSSLNAVIKLNVRQGDAIVVHAWGRESKEFLEELGGLVAREFGEGAHVHNAGQQTEGAAEPLISPLSPSVDKALRSLSRGIAIGTVWKMESMRKPQFVHRHSDNSEQELQRLQALLKKAAQALDDDIARNEEEATKQILSMQRIMLLDPQLYKRAAGIIKEEHYTAVYAWWFVCEECAREYRALENNEYLRARADDVIDVGMLLVQASDEVLVPVCDECPHDAILFIDEVSPQIVSSLIRSKLRGIVTKHGEETSHAAIIARSQNIPMVSGFEDMGSVGAGKPVILNACDAEVIVDPCEASVQSYEQRRAALALLLQEVQEQRMREACTLDEVPVECSANVGGMADITPLLESGAEGVGLLRSEFLFLGREAAPDEEEQYEVYAHAAKALKGKSLVIRLLDVGGDKRIPYIAMPKEQNPFLGMRGVRFVLAYKQLLVPQLRAILRAAVHGAVRILVPMVSDEGEILAVKECIAQVHRDLVQEHKAHVQNVPIGIMVETPASVLGIAGLGKCCDFLSIGTNDLIQYILAVERETRTLRNMYDVCHPAVLRAIKQVSDAARDVNIPISVCGEAASDLGVVPLFLGMGITKLSVAMHCVATLKHFVRGLRYKDCEAVLHNVWGLHSAEAVRACVHHAFPSIKRLYELAP